MASRGTRLVRSPILVTTILVRSVSSAPREGRTMSLRSTPASTFSRSSPTVAAGMLCLSALSLATLRVTSLGVVTFRARPERSMVAPRLTESAAPPKRVPIWSRADETLVAVVQTVFLSPSMLSASGRPSRTATREPSSTGLSTLGTTESWEPGSMPLLASTSPTLSPKVRTVLSLPSTETVTDLLIEA